ncbi:MAG: cytochrome c3 family protein [Candidatus Promineofilum sp.]|nr:cytochrome c3 family protein [Promineifilum sp.]
MRFNKRPLIFLLSALLLFGLLLAACSVQNSPATGQGQPAAGNEAVAQATTAPAGESAPAVTEVEVTRVVEVPVSTGPSVAVPFYDEWANSGHNNAEGEPFNHWNEDDPAEVPTECARCHSSPGYIDYLGADGSTAGLVDAPAPIGTTIECTACHNEVTLTKTNVMFPSGIEIADLGDEARCMVCHQGLASTVSVNQLIADAGVTDKVDVVTGDLSFTNIHYYAAAATQYGTLVKGGYEYDGLSYDARFDHVPTYNTCIECHDMHTLELNLEQCQACHADAKTTEDLANIRMNGSLVDYDGDGDMKEGIKFEIDGLREKLYAAMQAYSMEKTDSMIGYSNTAYPYFFVDTDMDGTLNEGEAIFPNAFKSWTARLSKAAYNFLVSEKDPGVYAHGGKYVIQLLYDSINDLNAAVETPVDLSTASRIDMGHFAGSEEAFRHWDAEGGVVPRSCAKCHSAGGQPQFITEGVVTSQPSSNGLSCGTCHDDVQNFTIFEVPNVKFPSGKTVSFGERDSAANMCMNCHQGRESTVSVNTLIGDKPGDVVDENLRFLNIHYYAAGATLFGTDVKGAYEFAGREYTGQNQHVGVFNSCTECHDTHSLQIVIDDCAECHQGAETLEGLRSIRMTDVDYDGDGDTTEGVYGEIDTLRNLLYAAIQAYSIEVVGTPILYDSHAYPYWFADTDGNGRINDDEGGFASWTPNLLRAAYNYQDSQKDPGGFAHNSTYVIQVLFDSIEAVNGDVSSLTRAPVRTWGN